MCLDIDGGCVVDVSLEFGRYMIWRAGMSVGVWRILEREEDGILIRSVQPFRVRDLAPLPLESL